MIVWWCRLGGTAGGSSLLAKAGSALCSEQVSHVGSSENCGDGGCSTVPMLYDPPGEKKTNKAFFLGQISVLFPAVCIVSPLFSSVFHLKKSIYPFESIYDMFDKMK